MKHATKPTWQQGNQITNLILAMGFSEDATQVFVEKGGIFQDLMSVCLLEQLLNITGKEQVEQFRLKLARYLFQGVHSEISAITRMLGDKAGFKAPATLPCLPFTLKQIAQYIIAAGDVRVLHYVPAGYTFEMAAAHCNIFFEEGHRGISQTAIAGIKTAVTEGRFVLWSLNNQKAFLFSDMTTLKYMTGYGHTLGYLRARIPTAIDLLYLLNVMHFTHGADWRYYCQCDPGIQQVFNTRYFGVGSKTETTGNTDVFMRMHTGQNKPHIYFSSRPIPVDEQEPYFYVTPITTTN